jgi:ribosomal protein S18 acetylase RimI-like enzyme
MRDFVRLPRALYSGNSSWVPPLLREVHFKLDTRRNPFFRYGSMRAFVAYDNAGKPCGRICAIINPYHQELHGEPTGFFGMFECIDNVEVAQLLVNAAQAYISAAGYTTLLGPVNYSTNEESGFLLNGFDRPPTFMCNYCLPYYHDLMLACGFEKAIDTLSYETAHGHPFPKKYERVLSRVRENRRVTVRRFDKKHADRDMAVIREIYNESFRDTWGFVPLSEGEAQVLGKNLLSFADFDLVWIGYFDDRPVGAILGFPDLNEVLKHLNGRLFPFGFVRLLTGLRSIQGMRVAAFGVLPKYRSLGIETLLIYQVHQRINNRPYRRAEFSVVMEDNHRMRQLLEAIGFTLSRRFRLYQKAV